MSVHALKDFLLLLKERSMNWKFLCLTVTLFVVAPYQTASAEVVVHPHSGPTCRLDYAGAGYCLLHLDIRGEITSADVDEVKRLVEQAHLEAERKKSIFLPPLVELDSPGGSVSAVMAIGRLLRKEYATAQMRQFRFYGARDEGNGTIVVATNRWSAP
jgi:membrane-bound ClpP family serine protease